MLFSSILFYSIHLLFSSFLCFTFNFFHLNHILFSSFISITFQLIPHVFFYFRETLKPWQEERSFNVSAMKNSTEILNLRKWTFYDIRIFGATVKGKGLVSANITIRTDSDGMPSFHKLIIVCYAPFCTIKSTLMLVPILN